MASDRLGRDPEARDLIVESARLIARAERAHYELEVHLGLLQEVMDDLEPPAKEQQ